VSPSETPALPRTSSDRSLWLAYAGLCLLCWALYVMAGTEWQRGGWHLWKGLYLATWNLGPPIVLGCAGLPWVRWLQRTPRSPGRTLALHVLGAAVFVGLWQAVDYAASVAFYGTDHANATLQRMVLWNAMWGVFVYLALMLGFGGALHARRANQAALGAAHAEAALVRAELAAISGKLNPHFLFNTLNSIYSLSLQKSDRTAEIVVRLADIMRYLIYECNEEKIPLDNEIEFIRNYIEIEKLRHQADIRLTVEGSTEGLLIEPFLFISFIENGFKHAMDHTFGEPFIYITVRVSNGQVALNVINSTNADLEIQAKKMNGMGIAHSRSLLELLYPASYDLDIIQTEKDESRTSELRMRNARERLENLYPDSHTLDVILNKSTFTVSLILKTFAAC